METEIQGNAESALAQLTVRLSAAIEALELVVPRIAAAASSNPAASSSVGPIVATVESSREAELSQKLADAERTIAQLRASHEGRRTLPVSLIAKQDGTQVDAGALDAALVSLSLEQRIAVKAQLLRAGLV